MIRPKVGYTTKQFAYAQHSLSGSKRTKKEMALAAGFSPSVATSVKGHIESTEGYSNAMAELAAKTGNVALKVLHELMNRDLSQEDTKTMLYAVSTLSNAFDKFTPKTPVEKPPTDKAEALRAVLLAKVVDIEPDKQSQPTEQINPIDAL